MKCYACNSTKLIKTLSLGLLASCGKFPNSLDINLSRTDCKLFTCAECHLTQLHHELPITELYGEGYGYESSLNKSMQEHLFSKSNYLNKKYNPKKILDIGCNDGTFLGAFNKNIQKFGIDPSIKPKYLDDMCFFKGFFPENFNLKNENFDLITALSVFYDLPDPNKFLKKIREILSKTGIFHIELSYLPTMIENNSFDTVCHEHLEYYSLSSLKNLLDKSNLHIIDFGFNDINGGSIWVDISHDSFLNEHEKLHDFISNESMQGYNNGKALIKLQNKINILKDDTKKMLKSLKSDNKIVHGLGASTKGNTLLQFYELNSDLLPQIEEVNLKKKDKYTPGTKIPIVIEDLKNLPDFYFVLPWHFRDFFIKKYKNSGVGLIFPLPELEIIYP